MAASAVSTDDERELPSTGVDLEKLERSLSQWRTSGATGNQTRPHVSRTGIAIGFASVLRNTP